MILLRLVLAFIKVGFFSVGGGLATLPFLYELSVRTGWFTAGDIADMIAISESTPGAIGINMSTYAGYVTAEIHGGILATLSLALPSVIIIILVARALQKFRDNPLVGKMFYGLRPASLAMITAAGLNVAKTALVNMDLWEASGAFSDLFLWHAWILGIIIFVCSQKFQKIHPILWILFSAVVGIVFKF